MSIGDSAFSVCFSLSSIELPESLRSIGECAFGIEVKILYNGTKIDWNIIEGSSEVSVKKIYYKKEIHEHDYKEESVKEATCTEEGQRELVCDICGDCQIESIPKEDHKEEIDEKIEATCDADGRTQGSHCAICGKVLVEPSTIKATGHSWDAGEIWSGARCEYTGEIRYTCTKCGETKTEEIVAPGHKFSPWKVISKADIDSAEKQSRSCSVCGKSEQREVGSKLQPSMTVSASKIVLKIGQKTDKLKISNLAKGDAIVSWQSDNEEIAQVWGKADGSDIVIIAGNKTGEAKITITLKSNLQKTITVTVQKKTVKTKKISGVAKKLTLKKKQKLTLHPVITPLTSTEKITYKSSNSKIVSVNSKGRITAKKKGKAVITVKSGKKKVKCKVTVK